MATATQLPPPLTADELEDMIRQDDVTGPLAALIDDGSTLEYPRLVAVGHQLTLLSVLREHGVRAYRPEDIDAYKSAMVKPYDKRENRIFAARVICIFASFAGLFGSGFGIANSAASSPAGTFFLVMFGLSFISLLVSWGNPNAHTVTAAWGRYELAHYRNEVPMPVVELMNRLRQNLPNARLLIEEFQVERQPLDPLLYVQLGGAEFCVAVWDEPRFDAPLMH